MTTSIFKFYLDMSYTQAFETIVDCCESIGLTKFQNYAVGQVVGKWNTFGHAGTASMVLTDCTFQIKEIEHFCYITATITGKSDAYTQHLFFNRAKRYLKKTGKATFEKTHKTINNVNEKSIKSTNNREHNSRLKSKPRRKLNSLGVACAIGYSLIWALYILAILFSIPFGIILKTAGIKMPKLTKMPKNTKVNLWREVDNSCHFDEDSDMHDVDDDGYCYECDEYEEDMR